MRFFIFFSLQLLIQLTLQSQRATEIPIQSAARYIGQNVIICDLVVDVFKPEGESKPIYINFGAKYPNQIFTAIIFAKDQPSFPYNPVEKLKNLNICITGKITEYKGKPQMVLNDHIQIIIKS